MTVEELRKKLANFQPNDKVFFYLGSIVISEAKKEKVGSIDFSAAWRILE